MLAPEREKLVMGKLEDLDNLFAGRHFDREVIILCVLAMAHTTIMRWV